MYAYNVPNLGSLLFKLSHYLRYGYVRYAQRHIPEGKDLQKVDTKLLDVYRVTDHHTTRARRKNKGLANVVYLRFQYTFLLLATEGDHETFNTIYSLDIRTNPLYIHHYSVGIKQNRPHIIIAPQHFKKLRHHAMAIALHRYPKVAHFLTALSPFSFAGINNQRWKLYCEVNKKRKKAGLPRIKWQEIEAERNRKKGHAPPQKIGAEA
jgi:hypothetical protein